MASQIFFKVSVYRKSTIHLSLIIYRKSSKIRPGAHFFQSLSERDLFRGE
jgi:hypothetical protein